MKNLMLLCFVFHLSFFVEAQSIVGKWITIDDETGKEKSIVNIYKKGGKYFGDIIKLINPKQQNPKCNVCKGKNKNKPVLGMTIIENMELNENIYENGTILNPSNGKIYKCRLKLEEDTNKLQVRGYIALFFKTQYWQRVD